MDRCVLAIFFGAALSVALTPPLRAQKAVTEFTPDANGNMVQRSSAVSSDGDQALVHSSLNGETVPIDSTDTKVLSETPTSKVTEQVVRHYDAAGTLLSTDRIVTEEHKRPNGGSSVEATIQHSDLNGDLREVEKRATNTTVAGKTSTSEETISRIGLDGSLTPEEMHKIVKTGDDKKLHEEEDVFKLSPNGQFTATARDVTDSSATDNQSKSQTAHYQVNFDGNMALDNLKVTSTAKAADGSQVTEVNTYGYQPGVARSDGPPQSLQSQQVIDRKIRPDGTVAETLSVSLPTLADPNRLGPPSVVSEKICSGKCQEPKP